MRIRMRVTLTGTYNGEPWPSKGEVLDVPDDVAEQLVRYGAAELVEEPVEEPAPEPVEEPPGEPVAAEPKTATARKRAQT
ncbi:hypothetical protein ACFUJ0_06095 [Streptomyces sp. NPDC057242]|uniref:hypothetical protein n=1 Tax=unclassified Streptomyces TaxID=2593676 RepID=UPI00363E0594